MKTIRLACLFFFIIIYTSCDKFFGGHELKSARYKLQLSFQDASGNDLLKGIEVEDEANFGRVKSTSYTLDVSFPEPCDNWDKKKWNPVGCDDISPFFVLGTKVNFYFLGTLFMLPKDYCPEIKMFIHRIKFPHLFGDNEVHELVTYWEFPVKKNRTVWAKCTRIEFEDSVITQITYDEEWGKNVYNSFATIILENRVNQ